MRPDLSLRFDPTEIPALAKRYSYSSEGRVEHIGLAVKSRGYFTNAQWEAATDQLNLNQSIGGINITYLGVDGILVDTSFSVKKPMPMWPLALLIGLTVLFAVLAVVLYLVEEEKGNIKLKKMFFPQAGKVQQRKMLLEQDLKKRKKGKKAVPPPTEKPVGAEEE